MWQVRLLCHSKKKVNYQRMMTGALSWPSEHKHTQIQLLLHFHVPNLMHRASCGPTNPELCKEDFWET